MRTLLLGTDFVYNSNGDLIPIEINTNVSMASNILEDDRYIHDLTELRTFITTHNFTFVSYIGSLVYLSNALETLCTELFIQYQYVYVGISQTVPDLVDTEEHLIIRSAYDMTAIVDEEYCKNKINFLELIKTKSYASQFAYVNEHGEIINNITEIKDNGNHPNFIMKSIFPAYDKDQYPKLFKVSNQQELNDVINSLMSGYFLMEFHFNSTKLYNGTHMKLIRSYNLLVPPNLESISLGYYTQLPIQNINTPNLYDPITHELNYDSRTKYIIKDFQFREPKLLDTDLVEMADGTFKTGLELQVGDIIKTIEIPNPEGINTRNITANYHIDYQTFVSGTTYNTNKVLGKRRVDAITNYVTLTFSDGTTWEDTHNSSYLIYRNNEVRFAYLNFDMVNGIKIGDKVILIASDNEQLVTTMKEIINIEITKQIFGGWLISVEEERLFLTRSDENSNFVAIEHNGFCSCYGSCDSQCECNKGETCCFGECIIY